MPVRDRPLRVGILGTGWVAGDRHLPVYQRDKRTEIVAVCDRKLARARAFAAKSTVACVTASVEEFLAQKLDLVSICTPPFAHRDEAIAALNAGANVFMEKPMAMSSADAEAIAATAAETGRTLCISHNFLFSRSMRRLRAVLDSGEAGRIQFVMGVQASSPQRRLPTWYGTLPAGLFFDESPHLLYIIASLLGQLTVTHASAVSNAPGSVQPVRSVHAVFSSPVAPATLTMTFETPVSEWYVMVICEKRVLIADLFRDVSIVLGPDGAHGALDILKTSAATGAQHVAGVATSGARLVAGQQKWGHDRLIGQMIGATIAGGPAPVPLGESLQVVKVTDAILRAIA